MYSTVLGTVQCIQYCIAYSMYSMYVQHMLPGYIEDTPARLGGGEVEVVTEAGGLGAAE